jgi:hypothetical protein
LLPSIHDRALSHALPVVAVPDRLRTTGLDAPSGWCGQKIKPKRHRWWRHAAAGTPTVSLPESVPRPILTEGRPRCGTRVRAVRTNTSPSRSLRRDYTDLTEAWSVEPALARILAATSPSTTTVHSDEERADV